GGTTHWACLRCPESLHRFVILPHRTQKSPSSFRHQRWRSARPHRGRPRGHAGDVFDVLRVEDAKEVLPMRWADAPDGVRAKERGETVFHYKCEKCGCTTTKTLSRASWAVIRFGTSRATPLAGVGWI